MCALTLIAFLALGKRKLKSLTDNVEIQLKNIKLTFVSKKDELGYIFFIKVF